MFFTWQLECNIKNRPIQAPLPPSALVITKMTLFFLSSSSTKLPLTVRVLQCWILITDPDPHQSYTEYDS
jgi:hypothetical protein